MNLGNPIATGNTADIYLHENKAIKLFNDYLPGMEAEYEANKQRYACACGLPVPEVFDVTDVGGRQAIIMEYVPGKTLGDVIFSDMKKAEQYMSLSVDVQLMMHCQKADGLELMADKLHRQLLSASALGENQKLYLIEKLHSMRYENRLCHGDYHVFNLILCEGKVTIIDWVDGSAGDVKADVCRSYLLYSQYSTELASLYLQSYCEKSGLFQDDILAWEPIIAGARLSENVAPKEANRLLEIVGKYYT